MNSVRNDVLLLDGKVTGISVLPAQASGMPLLVFVHGGGATARSFDIPGHSQLERAAWNGFPAYALDRPGYGGSEGLGLSPDSVGGVFAANAEVLSRAISQLWREHGDGVPGVVVIGSSIGGAMTLHLAALWSRQEQHEWPLLGVAVADIGQQPPQEVMDAWQSAPPGERTDMRVLQKNLRTPPLWTLAPYQFELHTVPGILEPVLHAEGREVVGGWLRDWERVCRSITVPVHYRIAQFDTLWDTAPGLVDAVASALRTRSPYVDAGVFAGSSHGVADGVAGVEYRLQVLGFAARCAVAAATRQLLHEDW